MLTHVVRPSYPVMVISMLLLVSMLLVDLHKYTIIILPVVLIIITASVICREADS